jgi:hypothetical protein
LEGERLAALIRAGPGDADQVGQGPGNPNGIVRGACADFPARRPAVRRCTIANPLIQRTKPWFKAR